MQGNNVITMTPNYSRNPESVPALRKEISDLSERLGNLEKSFDASSEPPEWRKWLDRLSRFETTLYAALVLGIMGCVGWAFRSAVNSYLDGRTRDQITPLSEELRKINDNTNHMEGMLAVLQSDIALLKYSQASPAALEQHRSELNAIKNKLAKSPKDVPGFWITSFQVINLLSKATAPVTPRYPTLDLSNVSGIGNRGLVYPPGSVISLHKSISNSVFTDAIIYFDSDVVLHNVSFINCTLVLPAVQATPPVPLQNLGNQLLEASDFSHLVLTS